MLCDGWMDVFGKMTANLFWKDESISSSEAAIYLQMLATAGKEWATHLLRLSAEYLILHLKLREGSLFGGWSYLYRYIPTIHVVAAIFLPLILLMLKH